MKKYINSVFRRNLFPANPITGVNPQALKNTGEPVQATKFKTFNTSHHFCSISPQQSFTGKKERVSERENAACPHGHLRR
jgi:hypothetical protein